MSDAAGRWRRIEMVEGETLAQWIAKGSERRSQAIPMAEALAVARPLLRRCLEMHRIAAPRP
jgi:hypothetical protein